MYRSKLNEKLQESLAAVLPILAIVLILSFTIAPLPTSVLMAFLFGAVLLVVGMMFFSLGAELAMSPMGERVGACITKTRRVGIMLTLGFLLGFLITISEPDLQVLANQVQAVPNMVPHRHRGGRRGIVSLLRHAAYAALRPAQHDAGGLLHRGLCSRHVRAQGFPCRGVRLRRRDQLAR